MSEGDESYWLLSETSGIGETRDPRLQRHLPPFEGFRWLSAGWRDFWTQPGSSLAFGTGIFLLSVAFVWTLVAFGRDYILFPALAGFDAWLVLFRNTKASRLILLTTRSRSPSLSRSTQAAPFESEGSSIPADAELSRKK